MQRQRKPKGTACTALKRAVFQAMGSKTMQRSPAFPPVLTRYKLLEIERPPFAKVGFFILTLNGLRGL